MTKLSQYFWNLAEQLPSLIAMIGCIGFALMRWKRHPKISLMIVVSLGLLLLHAVVFMFIYDLVPPLFFKPDSFEDLATIRRNVFLVLGFVSNSVAAVGFALLLAAIFMQRKPVSAE